MVFQENTGIIRHIWFFEEFWKTSADLIVAYDAKNNTPMAATMLQYYDDRSPSYNETSSYDESSSDGVRCLSYPEFGSC